MKYILNDPTTENLMIPVSLPPKPPYLNFVVEGFSGDTDTLYTPEHQAACCYYTMVQGTTLLNKTLIHPVNRWAATNSLFVKPRAGNQFNAYYDRVGLKFFFATDPVTKKVIFSANSTDVVAHELGHALLDALRPDLFNTQAMEIWAFHESFGDINALLNLLQHDLILDTILQETNTNLRLTNSASKLAEEMGNAIYHLTGGRSGNSAASLRNAVNNFNYAPPETLPRNSRDDQLSSEPHNFSRVWTGTWYDALINIYEFERTKMTPKEALIKARDAMTIYSFRSLRMTPATIRFYDAIAKSMLVIDKNHNYQYNQQLNQAFIKRGILRTPIKPMVSLNWEIYQNMVNPEDEVMDEEVKAVRSKNMQLLSLPHFMMNVEVPNDTYHEFDESGDCTEMIAADAYELIEHANTCVEFLQEKDMIRPDKLSPFELTPDGHLIRTHFACQHGKF